MESAYDWAASMLNLWSSFRRPKINPIRTRFEFEMPDRLHHDAGFIERMDESTIPRAYHNLQNEFLSGERAAPDARPAGYAQTPHPRGIDYWEVPRGYVCTIM